MIFQPTYDETVLGTFLHDIGKLRQRAEGSIRGLAPEVLKLETDLLPQWDGRSSHKHALFTEAFFHWMETQGIQFPGEVRLMPIRHVAVYHHKPDSAQGLVGAAAWIAAEADRLASGMDRKPKDEEQEKGAWDSFIKTAMVNPFSLVKLRDETKAPRSELQLGELSPGDSVMPKSTVQTGDYQARYGKLAQSWKDGFRSACGTGNAKVFSEELLSLSERLLWAVPSSTVDQPDVSLHDHARAAAAIAGAMHQYHEARGELADAGAVKDRTTKKFRLIAGDLSGIQHSLFLLASQQVKGVNRILRARSFLMGLLMESAALEIRERLSLNAFAVLQMAGGRFLILAGDVPGISEKLAEARSAIEAWMFERYLGELSLNIALSESFEGEMFLKGRFREVQALVGTAVEESKQAAFSTCIKPVLRDVRYPNGACTACGVRPAREAAGEESEGQGRCRSCEDERRLGGDLPKVVHWTWSKEPGERRQSLKLWGNLWLRWHTNTPLMNSSVISAARLATGKLVPEGFGAVRSVANYIPRLDEHDGAGGRYERLSEEAQKVEVGEAKTFEHLAADALEATEEGRWIGSPLLAVLKADVDRLGGIFQQGSQEQGLGRFAGLSRMMDFFFSAQVTELIRSQYRNIYTVYAGGDDVLLLGPWKDVLRFSLALREEFTKWVGNNPDITISAAVELVKQEEPLNRAVVRAERRLEQAKQAGRNRVSAVDEGAHTWQEFARQIAQGDEVHALMASGIVGQSFLYRVLELDEARCRMENISGHRSAYASDGERTRSITADANWRARWGYQLARNILSKEKALGRERVKEAVEVLNGLLGLTGTLGKKPAPPARSAITMALYRTRKNKSERR